MKKNIAFAFLVFGGILALSSCKDDDMEVYVGEDLRDKEIIEAIKALPEPKTEIDEKDIDADFKYLKPDGYSGYTSHSGGRSGYYGYVDLGLSVKWATNNINNPLSNNEGNISAKDLFEKETKQITKVERPGVKEFNQQFPTVMSYDEYLAYTDMKILATEYKEYEKYLDKIDNAYSKAINTYNSNARDFKELIDNVGRAYAWGDLDGWASHAQSGKDSPQNISGKTGYDAATNLIGDGWRIPTRAEWQELVDKCQWELHDNYWLIKGPSGKKIILPNRNPAYNTSERSNYMSEGNYKYDVYQFNVEKKKIEQKDPYYNSALIRPVYSK